jgi:hypothetical protein
MIFAHIAGLDDQGKDLFYSQAKQFAIIDLDEFTSKIVSDKNMNIMYDKFDYYTEKSKDINHTKLQIKEFTNKAKDFERKMNIYWKTRMNDALNKAIKINNKQIIVIGYCTYFKNHKISINIKTNHKFFQKVNLIEHAKSIVEYNVDNYRDEIIEGVFPLEFLNHEIIIKKRDNLMFQYKRMGYHIDTINNILNSLHIASSIPPPDKLYYASTEEYTKKIPLIDNKIVAYADSWVAMVSAINDKNITKGFSGGKPFVRGNVSLEKNIYLYTLVDTTCFSPIASKGKVYKYLCTKSIQFAQKINIDNLHDKLLELDIDLQTT